MGQSREEEVESGEGIWYGKSRLEGQQVGGYDILKILYGQGSVGGM